MDRSGAAVDALAVAGGRESFETLAALTYAYALRRSLPQVQTLVGIALLVGGVVWAVRSRPAAEGADAHPN